MRNSLAPGAAGEAVPRRAPSALPALLVPFAILVAAACLSLPAILLAFGFATGFRGDIEDLGDTESWMGELSALETVHLMVLPGLGWILVATLVAALLSREPFRRRLGLVRPRAGWSPVPLYALASFAAGALGVLVAELLFDAPSAHLEALTELILEPRGVAAVYIILCLSVAPGVAEELLFRGFMQQRLQLRWPAPLAILVPAVLFALSHVDYMHATVVLPVGIWLSFVAWGTRSVVPSMLCHAVYNAGIMLASRLAPEGEPSPAVGIVLLAVLLASVLSLAVSASVLLRAGLRRP